MKNIREEIREIENYIKAIADTKSEQIAILSEAQSQNKNDEQMIKILAIAKKRIING